MRRPSHGLVISQYADRTYRSVRGITENLFEIWSAYDYIRSYQRLGDSMNEVAPKFFGTMHRGMFQIVILLLRHLAEPAQSRVRGKFRYNSSCRGLMEITFGKQQAEPPTELVEGLDR